MSRMTRTISLIALTTALAGGTALARDQVQIAGSSTVLPYAAIVAEIFGGEGIGVFGLSFYENNATSLQVATMNGVTPSAETIASGEYSVLRPLFFYIKQAHFGTVPGLKEYAELFVSDEIAGPGGPLAEYGLVPDPELANAQAAIANEVTLD